MSGSMSRPEHVEKLTLPRGGRGLGLWRPRRTVTAVDLDGEMLRVVQSVVAAGGPRVTRYAATPLEGVTGTSSPAERGRAMGLALRRLGLRTRHVVMGLPRAQVMLRTLDLPPAANAGELASMVHFQVSRDLPFAASEAVIDFTLQPSAGDRPVDGAVAGPEEGGVRVLAAVVMANLLGEFVEMVQAAGLHPEAIGLRSHANARCVELCRLSPEDRCVAVVSLQSDESIFDVLLDGTLAFSRVGPVPQPPKGEEDSAGLRLEQYVQDVLMEVVRGVHNHEGVEGHGAVTRLFVAGSTGAEQAVAAALARRFEVPAEVLDPVSLVGLKRGEGNGATGAQAAFGLALGAQDAAGLPFDFLHPRRPPVRRDTRRVKGLAIAAAVTCVFLGLTGWRTHLLRGRTGERASLQEQIKIAARNATAYRQVRAQANTVRTWEGESHRWLDHLALLSALLPPSTDLYVSSISAGSRNSLNLSVKVRSGEILNRVGITLREAGYDVKPSAITPVSDRYGYRFQAGLELVVPATMKMNTDQLTVPERPADDVSATVAIAASEPPSSGSSAASPPAPASSGGAAPTPKPVVKSQPDARETSVESEPEGPGEVLIIEEPQFPSVEPTPPATAPREPDPGAGERQARRQGEPGSTPGDSLRSRLPPNWETLGQEERRAMIERFRAERSREGGAAPRERRGGRP